MSTMHPELGRDFKVPADIRLNKDQEALFCLGGLAMMFAISTRIKELSTEALEHGKIKEFLAGLPLAIQELQEQVKAYKDEDERYPF